MADAVLCAAGAAGQRQQEQKSDGMERQRGGSCHGTLAVRMTVYSILGRHYPTGVTLTETSSCWPPEAKMTPSIGATSA